MVEKHVTSCDNCQRNKNINKKAYVKIPLTSLLHDKNPLETVHINCCSPWKIRYHNKDTRKISKFKIHLLSMVKACTSWSEFSRIKMALLIATATGSNKSWLCRYPQPKQVIQDNRVEFMGIEFLEMLESYGIKSKPTTVKILMANAISECIHCTLGEQLRAIILMSIGVTMLTHSFKCVHLHFLQHHRAEAHTHWHS
jgi:hypothetical protein